MPKTCFFGAVCCALLGFAMGSSAWGGDPIADLKSWLNQPEKERAEISATDFAKQSLSKEQAAVAKKLLIDSRRKQLLEERKKEWTDKVIQLGQLKMKFEFKVFGKPRKTGRSLYISMHGGGGAPPRVNEQQWRNQIRLYEPKEGVYLAPRAPTDTWNLWHQGHIDQFFARIIENAVLFEGVDPNRIYLMGYSAGGDGVYQLAPRMADQLAAASMMAGHPNNASALGLRNIGFAIFMGGKDAAYSRNKVAAQWKEKLEKLQADDPQGYQHKVTIYPEFGHWMNRKDAVAVEWMAEFTRDPLPQKIVWHQSGTTHDRFYWLAVDKENRAGGSHIVAKRDGQKIVLEKASGVKQVRIRLNDEMLELDKVVTITKPSGTEVSITPKRTIASLAHCLSERFDTESVYSFETSVTVE